MDYRSTTDQKQSICMSTTLPELTSVHAMWQGTRAVRTYVRTYVAKRRQTCTCYATTAGAAAVSSLSWSSSSFDTHRGATGTGASKTLAKLRPAACVCVRGHMRRWHWPPRLFGWHGRIACIKIRSIPSSSSSVSHY
jgi:hypothetical protein